MAGRCRHCGARVGGIGSSTSSTSSTRRTPHYEDNCPSNPNNRDAPKPPPKSRRFQVPIGTLGLSVPRPPAPRAPKRDRGRGLGGGTGGASWSSNRVPPAPRIKKIKSQDSSVLSIAEQLVLLAQLRDSGALTEQEFQSLKSRLISGA